MIRLLLRVLCRRLVIIAAQPIDNQRNLPDAKVAAACYWIDRWIVDGSVDLVGRIPPAIGYVMRGLQMGLLQFYALAMVLGMLILVAARLLWAA